MPPNAPRVAPSPGPDMIWPADAQWRAPASDFPPRWASAWGDDAFGLWAELSVGDATQRLRWIEPSGPAGFWMGSPPEERAALADEDLRKHCNRTEHEPRRVVVSQGFWLGDTPCTQAFWLAVMRGDNPSQFTRGAQALQHPVEQVSWDDVQHFLAALQRRCPPLTDRAGLPTEVQWEYAARAGTCTAYPWGDAADDRRANWHGQHGGTTPVGRFAPNPWGLLDMHGNVFEWCADAWRERLDRPVPPEQEGPRRRSVRGGAWFVHPGGARSAFRFVRHPVFRFQDLGFRLALRSSSPDQAR